MQSFQIKLGDKIKKPKNLEEKLDERKVLKTVTSMFKIKGKSGEEIAVSELNTLDDDYFPDASRSKKQNNFTHLTDSNVSSA